MNTPLAAGEVEVRAGAANLQRGIETVGGRLHLTSHRLVFEPHRLNVRRGVEIVERAQITGVDKQWTRLFNLIPLAPNSIGVATADGRRLRFVVFDRDAWLAALAPPA